LDSAYTPRRRHDAPLHEKVASGWRRPKAADIIRRVLVLAADHELNASTFATRVAVSTGAPLSAGVLSGLATLSGPLHGRASLGVLELIAATNRSGARSPVSGILSIRSVIHEPRLCCSSSLYRLNTRNFARWWRMRSVSNPT
jgi:citrate synthase